MIQEDSSAAQEQLGQSLLFHFLTRADLVHMVKAIITTLSKHQPMGRRKGAPIQMGCGSCTHEF